jgi:hypothetical protein
VRRLRAPTDQAAVPVYRGVSYCDAVRRAGAGESLRILPGSIQVCRWAPVVLGLKPPEGRFEDQLAPRLRAPVAGMLLAPLDRFPGDPEVVLVRTTPQVLRRALDCLDPGELWEAHGGHVDRSGLPFLLDPGDGSGPLRSRLRLINAVNRTLAALAPLPGWQALTRCLFRSHRVTVGFDALISRALPDMSMCRNTTVVPLLTGRVNGSFFCTGGITWGRNRADHLVSGWPPSQFRRVAEILLAGGNDG